MFSRWFQASAATTAVLYPVGKGQPRRSPMVTVMSLIGNGILWYWVVLAVLLAVPVLGLGGCMLWTYLDGTWAVQTSPITLP